MNCGSCRYFFHEGNYGVCKRYPEEIVKGIANWCGEHKEKFVHPTEEVKEVKAKRGKNVSKTES